ncbi:MAG: LuxR C-terminal-related transcriptional regulator [Chloroflexota bacterium]|jgi:DNA-binding CsgD family transcriptional regulator/tetratricopeptide (TPR) repeat protein
MAFLGRERELAQLAEAVRRVAEGRLGRVVLTGPAGIGCTRLLDELTTRMSPVPGVTTCHGRAYQPAQAMPYQAVSDALSRTLGRIPDEALGTVLGPAAHDVSILVPSLIGRLDRLGIGRDPPALIAPDQLGRRVLESILGTLERLAGEGVLLLILEDVHFADPATCALVESLHRMGRKLPVCLVISYQPDEVHRRHPMRELAEQLLRDPGVERMELGPLSSEEIERLVTDKLGQRPPANVLTAIDEGARGNPLFALRLAESVDVLEGIRLSDTFDQLCGARLEAMNRDAARVVRVLSIARGPLRRRLVLDLEPPGGRLTNRAMDDAIESGFVVEMGERIAISHVLCAESIEALELTLERQAIAAALAERLTAAPALAAWFWSMAARPREARDAHIQAATAAMQLDPGESVLRHFEAALELPWEGDVTPEMRASVLAGAAGASASAGHFRHAVALQRQAIDRRAAREASSTRGARDEATRAVLGEMYADLGRYQWAAGELEGALDSMDRALGIMPASPSRMRARALAALAQHLMIAGRFEESAQYAEQARTTAMAASAPDEDAIAEYGHATCTLGVDAGYLGDLERGLDLLKEASDIARRAGRLDDLMRAAANLTTLLDLDSRREEALEVTHAFLDDAAAGGLAASYGAFLHGNAADTLYHLGRWAEAEAECRTAMDWRMSALEAAWWPPLVLGLLLTELRADAEAASQVGQAVLGLETVPAGQWTGHMLRATISLALWTGDPEGALSVAEREWPRALETEELTIISWAAATCLEAAAAAADHGRDTSDAGLIARARALAELVIPEAQAEIDRSPFGPKLGARIEAQLSLRTARAHAERIRDRADPDTWAELAVAWRDRPMPYLQAKARWWQALAILAAASEKEREAARLAAQEPLAEAFTLARELGALPLQRALADLSKRARIPLPEAVEVRREMVAVGPGERGAEPVAVGPGAGATTSPDIARAIDEQVIAALRQHPADTYGLSPREREVLDILAEGRTDRDIAARLFISERTVHVHVRRILAKLGVSSRTEAAGVAIRKGLVPTGNQAGAEPKRSD